MGKSFDKFSAFTLAETLMALVVIGIVASFVLPSLVGKFSDRTLDVQRKSFDQKFHDGLETMRLGNKLMTQYETTKDFVDAMQQYFNITQVCDSAHLDDCFKGDFTAKVYDENGVETASKTFKTNAISDTESLSPSSDYNSDLVGVKFADGTGAILTRNSSCSGPRNDEVNGDVFRCLGYVGFVGNLSKAHTLGRDMVTNMDLLSNKFGLSFKIIALLTRKKSFYDPIEEGGKPYNEMEEYCKAKGGSLPSTEQLTEIANKIYLADGANCKKSTANGQPYYTGCNRTIIMQQPLKQYLGIASFYSRDHFNNSANHVYNRVFDPEVSTTRIVVPNNQPHPVLCVK